MGLSFGSQLKKESKKNREREAAKKNSTKTGIN